MGKGFKPVTIWSWMAAIVSAGCGTAVGIAATLHGNGMLGAIAWGLGMHFFGFAVWTLLTMLTDKKPVK